MVGVIQWSNGWIWNETSFFVSSCKIHTLGKDNLLDYKFEWLKNDVIDNAAVLLNS